MSSDTISLTLEDRQVTGKAVKALRRDGQVPAVIHNHGKDSIVVQGEYIKMLKVWQQAGKHHPVQLKTTDKTYTALIKEVGFDPKKHLLTHVVFNAVDRNQKVEAEIPVKARYAEDNEASPAERSGFIVLTQLETVQVKAIPTNLPDVLEYDAEKLIEVGDSITVADLIAPEGVEIETDESHAIATVYEPSALAAANDAAGGDAEEPAAEAAEGEAPTAEGESAEASESSESEASSEESKES